MSFWACLVGSELKLIFHWKAHSLIIVKSLLISKEQYWNHEQLRNVARPLQRVNDSTISYPTSRLYKSRTKGLEIDPCEIIEVIPFQDESWPFNGSLCFQYFKKSNKTKTLKKSFVITYDKFALRSSVSLKIATCLSTSLIRSSLFQLNRSIALRIRSTLALLRYHTVLSQHVHRASTPSPLSSKTPPFSFLPSPPLNLQTVQVPPF